MDCGVDTWEIGHYYTVRDDVWRSVVPAGRGELCLDCPEPHVVPDDRGQLCLDCLQTRLGRPLVYDDFVATPDEFFERMFPPDGKPYTSQWLDDFWQKEDEEERNRRQLWLPGVLDPADEYRVVGWLQDEYELPPQGLPRLHVWCLVYPDTTPAP